MSERYILLSYMCVGIYIFNRQMVVVLIFLHLKYLHVEYKGGETRFVIQHQRYILRFYAMYMYGDEGKK